MKHAGLGHSCPLVHRLGLIVEDTVIVVDGELPPVVRMSFLDIDAEERDLVCVPLVNLVEAHGLTPKWRSGIGTEYQCDGFSQTGG